jgi:hypothetical protein
VPKPTRVVAVTPVKIPFIYPWSDKKNCAQEWIWEEIFLTKAKSAFGLDYQKDNPVYLIHHAIPSQKNNCGCTGIPVIGAGWRTWLDEGFYPFSNKK